ncbi:MAG: hypothetical protein WC499_03825 [Patescibacteria group bacterium]|jgi:hypothetical protein
MKRPKCEGKDGLTTNKNIQKIQELREVKEKIRCKIDDKFCSPPLIAGFLFILYGCLFVAAHKRGLIIFVVFEFLGYFFLISANIIGNLIDKKSLGEAWAQRKFPELFQKKEKLEKEIKRTKKEVKE